MANAGLGLPYPFTVAAGSPAADRPWSNCANDEPGLVVSVPLANNAYGYLDIDLDPSSSDVSFASLVGVSHEFTWSVSAYTSSANRTSGTGATVLVATTGPLSSNRTGMRKAVAAFAPTSRKYLRVTIRNVSGSTVDFQFWRFLVGKWVSPDDNIEVQAQAKIDDRQQRRYGTNGRRNFNNVGIFPAFTGKWPWLSPEQYRSEFKPMMLTYGASIPVLFCLDIEDTEWGEDETYYGDLEKDQGISMEDGQLFSYEFSIVDIAPVA